MVRNWLEKYISSNLDQVGQKRFRVSLGAIGGPVIAGCGPVIVGPGLGAGRVGPALHGESPGVNDEQQYAEHVVSQQQQQPVVR